MKSSIGWAIIAVVAILSVNSLITGSQLIKAVRTLESGEGVGTVKGRVVDQKGEPLAEAYVWIEKEGVHTWSGKDGNFTIENVSVGFQTLNIWKLGYGRASVPFSVYPGSMVERWGSINDIGKVELRRELHVNETPLQPTTLTISVNYSGELSALLYTLTTPAGRTIRQGHLEEVLTLDDLLPGTYVLNISGDNRTHRYTFYLPPGGKSLTLNLERDGAEMDLRTLCTLLLNNSHERGPEWIIVNLTERYTGWSSEEIYNFTGTLILAVKEGLYNITVGSPYTESVLYTNISSPGTVEIDLALSPVEEGSISFNLVLALALFYILIGVFGFAGAALVYMRKRYYTVILCLVLLMFSPTPSVYFCSIGVLLGLAAILMLRRIKGEFNVSTPVTGSSSGEE